MNEILACRSLFKSYLTGEKRIEVLKGLDLEILEGEMVAIIGESGVGKSTLLHILGAIDPPDSGQVRLRGEEIFSKNHLELSRFRNREIGFVFQFHHLLPEFTALENVMMPILIFGTPYQEALQPAREILRDLGLVGRLHHRPGQLSGGEQQRVAIARAIVMKPSLILADEPTGNLDPKTSQSVFSQMRQVQRKQGLAMIVATHNENLADKCDRIFRIEDGKLKALNKADTKKYFEI
jgi:lipoprotein-releasing system ATP-binding protein